MASIKEKHLGVALFEIGVFVTILTYKKMDRYPYLIDYPRGICGNFPPLKRPFPLKIWECPISVIHAQEVGSTTLAADTQKRFLQLSIFRRKATGRGKHRPLEQAEEKREG